MTVCEADCTTLLALPPRLIGFGATANGKWFCFYSYATILILIVTGVWAFLDAPRLEANLLTSWLGVRERINIYGYMLWLVVLAVGLWRAPAPAPADKPPVSHPPGPRRADAPRGGGHRSISPERRRS